MRILSFAFLVSAMLPLAPVEAASVLAYSASATQGPNQSYSGNFGMDFTPNAPVEVTELGLYSGLVGGGTGTGFAGDDFVTLFNSSGTVLAQLEFGNGTGNGTLVAGTSDYVKSLTTPLVLTEGSTYTIAAFYTNGTDQLANVGAGATPPAETGLPFISYVGSGRYGGATQSSFPGTPDGGPANRYNGPTFGFVVVPEPTTISLFSLGIVGLGIFGSRRWKQYTAAAFQG